MLKTVMLLSVLVLMALLCGCRTRVTNNTDVTGTIADSSGSLQDSYQVRRDELGIPVAKDPLFSWFSSDDEEYDGEEYDEEDEYYDDEDEYYDDEDEYYDDEDEDEDEDDDSDGSSSTPRVSSVQRRTPVRTTPVRRVVRPAQTTQPASIRVSLYANGSGAKCSKSYVMVKTGSTYGALPVPTWSGYEFDGWYTASSGGSKVSSTTKVTATKAHTLYAHWTKIKKEKKKYRISFDGNGGDDEVELSSTEMSVTEGGTYGDMPSAKRDRYIFTGWFTKPDGGSQVTGGSKFTAKKDQTLYAHWNKDAYTWWNNEFDKTVNGMDKDSRTGCLIDEGDDSEKEFLKGSGGTAADDESGASYIIKFIKNYDEEKAAEEVSKIREKYGETEEKLPVIIVSDRALKGSKEEQLAYRMLLHDTLYGSEEGSDKAIDEAISEMTEAGADVGYPDIYIEE